jgi:MFS family permease
MSFASLSLAVVLLVYHATGSFAAAGAAVGGFAGAAGALAPVRGRLVDRYGTTALLALSGSYSLALVALLFGAAWRWPGVPLVCAAAAAGATAPPLIAAARALWPRIAGDDLTRTSHALNAVLGDAAAVLGPPATGGLAAWLGPLVAFGAFGAGPLLGSALVAMLRVPHHADGDGSPRTGALRHSAGLRTIVGAGVPLGLALGALDVAAPALAAREGAPELAAAPLAAFAAGSVLTSIWAGQSDRAGTPQSRYALGFSLLALTLGGCLVARSVFALSADLLIAGTAYGLLNVGLLELLDDVVPSGNAVEALTWLTSAEGLGMAAGGAIAGALAISSVGAALVLVAVVLPPGAVFILKRRPTLAPRPTQVHRTPDEQRTHVTSA